MLRLARPSFGRVCRMYSSIIDVDSSLNKGEASGKLKPAIRESGARRKELSEVLGESKDTSPIQTIVNKDEIMDISGVPEEHQHGRRARIFKPARNAEQAGWNNTNVWKIELDQQERWENPLIGYSSTGDPLSNISMQLDFPSQQDAIDFCEKNKWPYTLERSHERQIKAKAYGSNFHWSKRTRVSTK